MNRRTFIRRASGLLVPATFANFGIFVPKLRATNFLARPAAGGPSYFLSEDFDASGYDNAGLWTEAGAGVAGINEDATASPLHSTSQYLSVNLTSSASTRITIPGKDVIYGFFKVRCNSPGVWLSLSRFGVDDQFLFRITGAERIIGYNQDTPQTGTTAITLGAVLRVWFEWRKGTGANGITKIYFSTTDTKPGSPEINVTTGNAVVQPTSLAIFGSASESSDFDRIRLSDSDITTVP